MSKEVIVIGGGIIGLCCAYYLRQEGHQVTVVDQSRMNAGASYVNAGFLAPSHLIPLSAPGAVKQGLLWMLNASSPLYIKPRLQGDFLRWALAFQKSCNSRNVQKAVPVIKDIALLSQELYDELKANDAFTFHYEKKGLLMLCQTEKMLKKELKVAHIAKENGLEVSELNADEVRTLEPNVSMDVIGATYYKCDSHTTPHEFMEDMKSHLQKTGVQLNAEERVFDMTVRNNTIQSITTDRHELRADEFVLAAGSWSRVLSKKLGLKLLLEAGKGYRINTERHTGITIPAILAEAKVAVTPMNGFTRFSGTMEIGGINHHIHKVRVTAIARAANKYYPDLQLTKEEKDHAACGLRPVTPDGLPYIGKSQKCANLTVATGHSMMGWSMATATGKLVSEIISKKPLSMDLTPFQPYRIF